MNFKTAFQRGQQGKAVGLPMGIPELEAALNGIQKSSIYGIAAAPKVKRRKLVWYCY
jgi:replicative DNA helicase